jgi:hypothetical protein
MHVAKQDIPAKIDMPGAVARMKEGFGSAQGYEEVCGEYFSLAAGTDLTPLLEGLEGNMCQSPHWGYVIQGKINVRYTDGSEEWVQSQDVFYWPPGHTLKVDEDADIILFSPQKYHAKVIEHVREKLNG